MKRKAWIATTCCAACVVASALAFSERSATRYAIAHATSIIGADVPFTAASGDVPSERREPVPTAGHEATDLGVRDQALESVTEQPPVLKNAEDLATLEPTQPMSDENLAIAEDLLRQSRTGSTQSVHRSGQRSPLAAPRDAQDFAQPAEEALEDELAQLPNLPSCAIADQLAPYSNPDEWQFTLLDHTYSLPKQYVPRDLISISSLGVEGEGTVSSVVGDDLQAMMQAAETDGVHVAVHSAYRSFETQETTYLHWKQQVGEGAVLEASARAGHSEHQLGTALDFRTGKNTIAPWDEGDWAKTPAGSWMQENAWKYGFIMSFPQGKTAQTCYMYEPWHFRYVGPDMALVVNESGLTLREFLWNNAAFTGEVK